jgi:hypothetical protein
VAAGLVPGTVATAHTGGLPPELLPAPGTTSAAAPPAAPATCPTRTDPAAFATPGKLLADNGTMLNFGRRPTGSPNQLRFIRWIERQLDTIPGVNRSAIPYTIDRWDEGRTTLRADGIPLKLSGPVPYAKRTPRRGVMAPLTEVPTGTAIDSTDVRGKIIVRDAAPGSIPYAAFRAVSWFEYDPDGTLLTDVAKNYERDFAGYNQRMADLEQAAEGGAAGIVFVHGFPRDQVAGQYAPYEGVQWKVPAVYVGVDEGERLKQLAARNAPARLTLTGRTKKAKTRTIVASLPGASEERIVVESHTDGMNAIWDNGPVGILGLARYFASLPRECRPRTLQFVFTTGHLYQRLEGGPDRGGGAEKVAQQLDEDYDKGSLALVFALEHLGAREYAAEPRVGGAPGRVLQQTGRNELNTVFVGESPLLVQAVTRAVIDHDIRRSFVMRGSDAPGARIPPHQSYGGEGTEYQQHLLPTIALVTGPWTLYNPAFGLEAIDAQLMQRQTLLFADLITELSDEPRELLGGGYLAYRAARDQLCASSFATLGLVRCKGDPFG